MSFDEGEEYTIRGKKGETGRYNTIINEPNIITPEQLENQGGEPEAAPVAREPETILTPEPAAPVEPEVPVQPEVPIAEEVTAPPEAEAPQPKLTPLQQVTQRAKQVLQTGVDSKGNPMPVETLIPLYLDQLEEKVRGFGARKEEYRIALNEVATRGTDSLSSYMDTLENYFKDYAK